MPFIKANDRVCRDERKRERIWRIAVFAFILIGLVLPDGGFAQSTATTIVNYLMLGLAHVFMWIIQTLGTFIIMLIDLLITVSQYNTFVHAKPVETGWPLIRDITNMFFIVILLLTAFSTIIRWKKFDYKSILPKLLLMAVLVNFSKTLIGLLIDLSQVIMLTFVNGFRAAAAGNFISALKLDQVMRLTSADIPSSEEPRNSLLLNILIAEMFGIFILGLSATMILMMVVYLMARIVGLWVALIISPGAFFLTAVPDSLKSKISGFGDNYWKQLGTLLTGGPVMAFFLWLTLAVVQSSGFDVTQGVQFAGDGEVVAVQDYFRTSIGTVENFGSYIIAILMMGMGLSMAVSSSSAISGSLGKATERIRTAGVGASRWLAYGGVAAGSAYAVSAPTRRAARFVDQRTNLSGRVGRFAQRAALATGATGIAERAGRVASIRAKAIEKEQKAFEAGAKGLSAEAYLKAAERRVRFGNPDEKAAMTEIVAKKAMTKDGAGYYKKKVEATADAKEAKTRLGEGSAEYEAYVSEKTNDALRKKVADYQASAIKSGDADGIKWAKEQFEKRPDLVKAKPDQNQGLAVRDHVTDLIALDASAPSKMALDAYMDPRVLSGLALGTGMLDENGKIDRESVAYKKYATGGNARQKVMKTYLDRIGELSQDGNVQAFLESGADAQVGLMSGRYVKRGNEYIHVPAEGQQNGGDAQAPAQAPQPANNVARDEQTINRAHQDLNEYRVRLEALRNNVELDPAARRHEEEQIRAEMQNVRGELIRAGEGVDRAFGIQANGNFGEGEGQQHFENHMHAVFQAPQGNTDPYRNMDVGILLAAHGGENEARRAFVGQADISRMHDAYQAAEQQNEKQVLETLSDMAKAIDAEGARFEKKIEAYNKRMAKKGGSSEKKAIDTNQLADIARKYDQVARTTSDSNAVANARRDAEKQLQKMLDGTGIKMDADDARAVMKRQEIMHDDKLQHFSAHASTRASRTIGKAKRATRKASDALGNANLSGSASQVSSSTTGRTSSGSSQTSGSGNTSNNTPIG